MGYWNSETASPEQAQEMHKFIRETVRTAYGNDIAEEVSILYGGSVNQKTKKFFLNQM
jgi:triosephosphate isomerase